MKKGSSPQVVFGKGLKALRESQSMTQETLADHAAIDRTYVYRLESGKRSPSLDVIIRVASAFKMTPGEFIDSVFK